MHAPVGKNSTAVLWLPPPPDLPPPDSKFERGDPIGKRFGHWTVLAIHPRRSRYRHHLCVCRCDCGAEHTVRADSLRRGKSTSCGCAQRGCAPRDEQRREAQRETWDEARRKSLRETARKRFATHGLSRSRAYRCWQNMLQRCFNPNHPNYADYGGRGITVCEDWRSFVNFYADMGDPPPGLSIHRVNNDGNYEPRNCCWAPPTVQAANRRCPKPFDLIDLRERISIGGPIKPREREFVLYCIDACAPPADGFTSPPF